MNENSRQGIASTACSREPDGFFTIPVWVTKQQKSTGNILCFLLVTLNQPKSNLLNKG
jgi:hypothetical protein